jgi:hypothetical protein
MQFAPPLRADLVMFTVHVGSWWPSLSDVQGPGIYIAQMLLLKDELAFEPPPGSSLTHLRPLLAVLSLGLLPSVGNLRHRQEFALREIDEFHTWNPPFSGPPMFQIGTRGWSFMLLERRFPMKRARPDAVKAHFDDVETTWRIARGAL